MNTPISMPASPSPSAPAVVVDEQALALRREIRRDRIAALTAELERLREEEAMDCLDRAEILKRVTEARSKGGDVAAVKLYRSLTGVSLRDALEAVKRLSQGA